MPGPIVWGSCFPTDEDVCKECAFLMRVADGMNFMILFKTDPCIGCRINQERINAGERAREWGY